MNIPQDHATQSKELPGKARLNFWIDWITAVAFAAMLGGGILLKWILPPGSRGGEGLIWLGQGRHFYGDIHFWAGIGMLTLVIVHVWLHWDWVVKTWRRAAGSLRSPVTWVMLVIFAALIFAPLLIPRVYSEKYKKEHDRLEEQSNQAKGGGEPAAPPVN